MYSTLTVMHISCTLSLGNKRVSNDTQYHTFMLGHNAFSE